MTGLPDGSTSPWLTFTATILKRAVNTYVDIPEGVSLRLAPFAQAGRIRCEGRLNGAFIRGTLIPVGQGRHVLYLNGGMRAAAGVGVGDTVMIALRGASDEDIALPEDLAAGISEEPGATDAYSGLPSAYRRELLRFIEDARTERTRARRLQQTVDHLLGKPPEVLATAPSERPLWTCPKCGNQFVTANQYHSCAVHSVDDPFEGKPSSIRQLFDAFHALVAACGPVTLVAYRDRVAFMVRVRFAGAVPKQRWLDVTFWLARRVESPRFRRIQTLSASAHIHTLRVTEPSQLDPEVARWVHAAYAIGGQEHLRGPRNDT